jgi:ferric-dicitrate binding protein FerR (iron transport regulator)
VLAAAGLATAAAVIVAIGLATRSAGPPPVPAPETSIGRIERVVGSARTAGPEAGRPVTAGFNISIGTHLETLENGRAAIRLPGGSLLRLDTDTRIRFDSVDVVTLAQGGVYLDSGPTGSAGRTVEIRTAGGIVRDVGTQFEVRVEPAALRVRVREGSIRLEAGRDVHVADAGTELLATGGTLTRERISLTGPIWAWTASVTPPFVIEGESLTRFLTWVSRETGWRVRFATPELERSAASIVLHGALEDVSPAEAPALVLPACGLVHRIENDTLVVGSATTTPLNRSNPQRP